MKFRNSVVEGRQQQVLVCRKCNIQITEVEGYFHCGNSECDWDFCGFCGDKWYRPKCKNNHDLVKEKSI
jgi:hypothetical protein